MMAATLALAVAMIVIGVLLVAVALLGRRVMHLADERDSLRIVVKQLRVTIRNLEEYPKNIPDPIVPVDGGER